MCKKVCQSSTLLTPVYICLHDHATFCESFLFVAVRVRSRWTASRCSLVRSPGASGPLGWSASPFFAQRSPVEKISSAIAPYLHKPQRHMASETTSGSSQSVFGLRAEHHGRVPDVRVQSPHTSSPYWTPIGAVHPVPAQLPDLMYTTIAC